MEPEPVEAATAAFGDRLPLARQYAVLLATEATTRGLIGPGELGRIWSRHLLNCAALAELVPPGVEVIDVGSGAGLPGLPLALARPDLRVTLVEPLLRRSSWLEEVVSTLALGQVEVRRARAEELAGRVDAPVVTARAVAPMERLARWCLPLVAPGGELLAMKGRTAATELAEAEPLLRRGRATSWEVLTIGADGPVDPTSVIRVRVGQAAAAGPRRRPVRSSGDTTTRGPRLDRTAPPTTSASPSAPAASPASPSTPRRRGHHA